MANDPFLKDRILKDKRRWNSAGIPDTLKEKLHGDLDVKNSLSWTPHTFLFAPSIA